MAVLQAKNIAARLILIPPSATGGAQTHLQLVMDGSSLLSSSLTLTEDDYSDLHGRLRDVAEHRNNETRFESTDADFLVEAERLLSPDDVAIQVWHGEPYMLMRGYRFVVKSADLLKFAADLLTGV
jgi:hypothetical protein